MIRNVKETTKLFGLENTDPPNPDALAPCSEPEVLNCADRRVDCRFRHRPPSQSMATLACLVAKDAEILRCFENSRQFEVGIQFRSTAVIAITSSLVGRLKYLMDR